MRPEWVIVGTVMFAFGLLVGFEVRSMRRLAVKRARFALYSRVHPTDRRVFADAMQLWGPGPALDRFARELERRREL